MKGPKLRRHGHPPFAISIDISNSPALHKLEQHLSNIQIVFVLAFHKVNVTQREIASILTSSRKAVRNALANYIFEIFKGRFYQRFSEIFNYPLKDLEARYRYGETMQEVWYSQGMEMVEVLIKSMPKRFQVVIDAKGGWTKY